MLLFFGGGGVIPFYEKRARNRTQFKGLIKFCLKFQDAPCKKAQEIGHDLRV